MDGRRIARALERSVVGALLLSSFALIRGVNPLDHPAAHPSGTAMALGFLLVIAFVSGQAARLLSLPRVTGYLLCGLIVGPEGLGLLTAGQVDGFRLINGFAVGVIAFIAGGELRPSMLRRRGRTILIMLLVEIAAVFTAVASVLFALRSHIPFLAGVDLLTAAALVALFAAIATVHSPAVTIALLDEQASEGPVSSTTLGIVLAADVVVVLLATAALGVAKAAIGEGGVTWAFAAQVAWELLGAIVMGAALGALVDLYLRWVGKRHELFALGLVLAAGLVARAAHVEYMLFVLSAGFFIENVSPTDGEPLLSAFGRVSVPAYALFFSVAGATLHVHELAGLWPVALAVVVARAIGLRYGCALGARLARAEPAVARYAWLGLISQAGVALGLVTVASSSLPEAGEEMLTLFLAMIAIHELLGPIAFRHALLASGEAGAARVLPPPEEASRQDVELGPLLPS